MRGSKSAFTIDSAGTYDGHAGEPPSRLAIEAAARRGYDISGLRARPVVAEDIAALRSCAGDGSRSHGCSCGGWRRARSSSRLQMFADTDVADPYGGNARDYERALDAIEAGCRDLLARLTPEAKAKIA